jgi:uncharacterized alpha-E superfamily protein
MWETLNRHHLSLERWTVDRALTLSPHEFFQHVKSGSQLFRGVTSRTLMDGEARHFLTVGCYLERANQTARILDVKYHALLPAFARGSNPAPDAQLPDPEAIGGPVDVHGWIAVMKSVGALEAFRKTYPANSNPTDLAGFVILNDQFPASIRYSLRQVVRLLNELARFTGRNRQATAIVVAERVLAEVESRTADQIVSEGMHEFLEYVADECDAIGQAVAETFLQY